MLLVEKGHISVTYEMTLTITSMSGTYYVCAAYLDTIQDLKTFLCPHVNYPYQAHPDEQSYYSMTYNCILANTMELGMIAMNPVLLLGLSDPIPCSNHIPQRSLVILPPCHDLMDSTYERILSIHRRLGIQYLPFLADWLQHDRNLSRIILDADHPQINWIVNKITDAIATYPPCLQQIIFSVTEVSLLQWELLHTLYKKTTVPIFLEAKVMGNRQEMIYRGQKTHELEELMEKPRLSKRGLVPLQPALLMKENPTEQDLATHEHILSYDDPNLGEFPTRLYSH